MEHEKNKKEYISITAWGKDYQFLDQLAKENDKELCIYGCGLNGEIICSYLEQLGMVIRCFVDKQADHREFTVLNRRVVSLKKYLEQYQEVRIIVSPDNQKPIIEDLLKNGVDKKKIISPFKRIDWNVRVLEDDYEEGLYISSSDHVKLVENDIEKKTKATIFTILYNTPKWMLCRTIESVLNQSYRNLSYLIIDNGSTDGSDSVIKSYAEHDERIHYIRLDKNTVWAGKELLNVLEKHIQSDYVAMLDSDDYYEPEFLERSIDIAEKENADIVQVNTLTYGHEGFKYNYFAQTIGRHLILTEKKKEYSFLLRILNVPVWGKLYSTELFKQLLRMMLQVDSEYDRDRNFCLDISWMTYMAMNSKKAVVCDDILHIRTWRSGSSEHADDHCSKWLSSIVWSFRYLRDHNVAGKEVDVFEDSALVWLFSLLRGTYNLDNFRREDIGYSGVDEFLKRPLCDKYRG